MFSFHKPKIYRSNLGCCICKAKSSSSRFTDSKKYEAEFEHCFRIKEQRSGEICNACVLLVKRWKKLSPENRLTKHWHHVVDARAGPGTKLTSGRRFATNSNSSSTSGSAFDASLGSGYSQSQVTDSSSSSTAATTSSGKSSRAGASGRQHLSSGDREPLSSSNQANTSAVGSRARAIDTNVSTFTFGEPIRRSYMSSESSISYSSYGKPNQSSAPNSSAFESVIKRFRQRKQQEQLEAQRRLLSRQQRSLRPTGKRQKDEQEQEVSNDKQQVAAAATANSSATCEPPQATTTANPVKRVKRSSESFGSLCVDGLRVSSLLDATVWRKEKICCGTIFRGLHNEVAVFPKLMKPCKCRTERRKRQLEEASAAEAASALSPEDEELRVESGSSDDVMDEAEILPPRAQKSGSISSSGGDSSTSGTGSMDQALAGGTTSGAIKNLPDEPASQAQVRRRVSKLKSAAAATGSGLNEEEDEEQAPTRQQKRAPRQRAAGSARRQRETRASSRRGGGQEGVAQRDPTRAKNLDSDSVSSHSSSSLSSFVSAASPATAAAATATATTTSGAAPNSPSASSSGASSGERLPVASGGHFAIAGSYEDDEMECDEEMDRLVVLEEAGELGDEEELDEEELDEEDEELDTDEAGSSASESLVATGSELVGSAARKKSSVGAI